jgi:hypothetical protein
LGLPDFFLSGLRFLSRGLRPGRFFDRSSDRIVVRRSKRSPFRRGGAIPPSDNSSKRNAPAIG